VIRKAEKPKWANKEALSTVRGKSKTQSLGTGTWIRFKNFSLPKETRRLSPRFLVYLSRFPQLEIVTIVNYVFVMWLDDLSQTLWLFLPSTTVMILQSHCGSANDPGSGKGSAAEILYVPA